MCGLITAKTTIWTLKDCSRSQPHSHRPSRKLNNCKWYKGHCYHMAPFSITLHTSPVFFQNAVYCTVVTVADGNNFVYAQSMVCNYVFLHTQRRAVPLPPKATLLSSDEWKNWQPVTIVRHNYSIKTLLHKSYSTRQAIKQVRSDMTL